MLGIMLSNFLQLFWYEFMSVLASASLKTKLITLVVAEVLSYVLEFSHRTLRIRQSTGEYLTVPNSTDIYEVSTPWTSDQLGKLQAAHKIDALFIVHPEVPPQRVFRAGVTNWTVTAIPFNWGEGVSAPWSPSQGYPSVAVFYSLRAVCSLVSN
jgi:hypothetical protein